MIKRFIQIIIKTYQRLHAFFLVLLSFSTENEDRADIETSTQNKTRFLFLLKL